MMYRVVIAEDSKPILRHIKQLIEQSDLPLQVVHNAFNGEEALDYMKKHQADILLTDIRMPKLDGLTLIDQAKHYCPELKVVLISSYSDFEYTRKALNLQVFDYLLKPVEQQQLEEVMQRIIDKLEEIQTLRQAVLGDIVEEDWLQEQQLDQAFFTHPKLMMLLSRQLFTPAEKWSYEVVKPLIADTFSDTNWLLPLKLSDRLLLLSPVTVRSAVDSGSAWAKQIHERLRDAGLITAAICEFDPVEPSRIYTVYHDLEAAMNQEITVSHPVLLELEHCHPHPRTIDASLRTLTELIHHRQKEQFMLKLSERLKHMKLENTHWLDLEQLLAGIEGAFCEARQDLSAEEGLADSVGTSWINSFNTEDYDQFCRQLLMWAEEQFHQLQTLNRKSGDELFEQMDVYIRHQIYTPLSIGDLAERFYVSPSYVSRIIKRYTGQTFVQYFMRLKIEEACRLMQAKPNLKIREVSDALAFSDQHYFSRVFKDHTGYTPTDYKDKHFLTD